MIQVNRLPVLEKSDNRVIDQLLNVFDRVTFNTEGEMLGELDTEIPLVGPVIVSYYRPESHVQVRRKADDVAILSQIYTGFDSKAELLGWVRTYLRNEFNKAMDTAYLNDTR